MRALTPLSLLARFVVMAALGLMILVAPGFTQRWLHALFTAALMINGVAALSVSLFQRREAHPHAMLSGVVSLGAGLFAALFPGVLMKSVTLAIGLWSLLVCVAQVGYVVQLIVMGERGRIKFALLAALSLVTGVSLLWGYSAGRALQWLAGVYLLVYALWQLMDLLGVLINRNVESSRLLSRLRVHPPVLLTALLPSVVLRRLSARYATLTQDVVIPKPSPARESWPETLEVVFHLGKNVAFGFGHVVVSLRGVTYSYGCYDESSNRLFGALSDGVILVSPTESYSLLPGHRTQAADWLHAGPERGSRRHAGGRHACPSQKRLCALDAPGPSGVRLWRAVLQGAARRIPPLQRDAHQLLRHGADHCLRNGAEPVAPQWLRYARRVF